MHIFFLFKKIKHVFFNDTNNITNKISYNINPEGGYFVKKNKNKLESMRELWVEKNTILRSNFLFLSKKAAFFFNIFTIKVFLHR